MIQQALLKAVYERLSGQLSAPVYYGGNVPPDASAPYLVVEAPPTEPRDTFTTRGDTALLSIRAHTRYPDGKANPLKRFGLLEEANDELQESPLSLEDTHRVLHLPSPSIAPLPGYDVAGERALDATASYTLMTQTL